LPLNRGSGVLVSTVGKGANEEVDDEWLSGRVQGFSPVCH